MEIDLSKPYIRLYHGSLNPVINPEPDYASARDGDFGKGFYTTSNKEQAIKWGHRKQMSKNIKEKVFFVSEYTFENSPDLRIKAFDKPNEEWFLTVYNGRRGMDMPYDMIIGPVADSKIYRILDWFDSKKEEIESALSPKDDRYKAEKKRLMADVIDKLSPESFRNDDQYVFITDKAIRKLSFEKWTQYNQNKEPVFIYEKDIHGTYSVRNANSPEKDISKTISVSTHRGRGL